MDLQSDDEDLPDANAERPISGDGHSFEGGSKESPIGDWDSGSAGEEILED